MEWLVVKEKYDGWLALQSRETREHFLKVCDQLNIVVPSIVIKTFDNMEDAINYLYKMRDVDNLLNTIE